MRGGGGGGGALGLLGLLGFMVVLGFRMGGDMASGSLGIIGEWRRKVGATI